MNLRKNGFICLLVISISVYSYGEELEEPKNWPIIDYMAFPSKGFSKEKPRITVTYYYAVGVKVYKSQFPSEDELKFWRSIYVLIDGKSAQFHINMTGADIFCWDRDIELKLGQSFMADLDLNRIFKLHKEWKVLEVDSGHQGGLWGRSTIVDETARAGENTSRIDCTVIPVTGFSRQKPWIKHRFYYASGAAHYTLSLPSEKQMPAYRGIGVRADGKPAGHRAEAAGAMAGERKIELNVGQAFELDVKLEEVFNLPKDWKELEIEPARIGPGFRSSLKVSDRALLMQQEQDKEQ